VGLTCLKARDRRAQFVTRKLDLNALLLFFEVVNAGSISRASKKLDIPKSTVSRKLMFLEDQLGAILFKKGGRKLAVTDIGHALYEHCERIAAEIEEAGLGTTRMQTELRGMLRVSMPVDFGTGWLSSAIAAFAVSYPDIHLVIDAKQPLDRCIGRTVRRRGSTRHSSRNAWRHPPPGKYFARRLCEPIVPRKKGSSR